MRSAAEGRNPEIPQNRFLHWGEATSLISGKAEHQHGGRIALQADPI